MTDLQIFSLEQIKNLHVYGRSPFVKTGDADALALFWTASGFAFDSKCGEVWALIESDFSIYEAWASVWIDGSQVSRFMLEKGKKWYCLFRGLSQDKVHHFALLKETQAMSADDAHLFLVHQIGLPKSFAEGKSSDEIFEKQKDKKLKIEFIGDSITTGEGLAGGIDEWDWITGWMATKDSYAVNLAKKCDADFRIISQSGWGVLCGWDNDITCSLPQIYTMKAGLLWGERNKSFGVCQENDFASWQPDYIIVNLGTNDWNAFNSPEKNGFKLHLDESKLPEKVPLEKDLLLFKKEVFSFLDTLREKNPKAKIIWAYGMCSFDFGAEIQKIVEDYAASKNEKDISFVKLPSMAEEVTPEEKGSRGHPGPGTHKRACQTLEKYIV